MLNNRGDKVEGQEESEYHFSDEEVNYEVDSESEDTEKSATEDEDKQSIFKRLSQSKRMLIGLGVFVVLVFVVYKIVTPSSTPIPSDVITPVAQQKGAMQVTAPTEQMVVKAPIVLPPIPGSSQAAEAMPVVQVPASPAISAMPTQEMASQSLPQQMQQQPQTQQLVQPPIQQQIQQQPPIPPSQMPPQQPMLQSVSLSQQALSQQAVAQQPVAQQLPLVQQQPTAIAPSTTSTMVVPSTAASGTNVDIKMGTLEANNQKLIGQLQSDYIQRLNDFYNQNKQLQDQLQGLATRVANMETQLNQLAQTLIRQQNQNATGDNSFLGPQSQAKTPKVPYNVQAIIPGRAWLRSDSGETVTVAEGDTIKEVGRVTKIDPYDGVVEINAGGRIVSLSYGNMG
ncbi:MAG TPA: hypothetical protein VJN02_06045 [Gammaproteobacteria bacterium]|nr:hypothetical protein [Gammaproteobacteria bacterium]